MKSKRLDLGMEENMYLGMKLGSARSGISPNSWVRSLMAAELTRLFGPGWVDLSGEGALTDESK